MTEQILLGSFAGLLIALYLSILLAAVFSRGIFGSLLAALLLITQGLSGIFEVSIVPKVDGFFAMLGIDATQDLTSPGIIALFVVTVGGITLSQLSGFIRFLRQLIDRIGAAITAYFSKPENPTDPAGN